MPLVARKAWLTVEQITHILKLFYENGKNANLTVKLFSRDYPTYNTLSQNTVLLLVSKFEKHGTKEDLVQNNSGRKKTERVPATIDLVKQQLVTNPQASIRRIEAQTGLKRSSVPGDHYERSPDEAL